MFKKYYKNIFLEITRSILSKRNKTTAERVALADPWDDDLIWDSTNLWSET